MGARHFKGDLLVYSFDIGKNWFKWIFVILGVSKMELIAIKVESWFYSIIIKLLEGLTVFLSLLLRLPCYIFEDITIYCNYPIFMDHMLHLLESLFDWQPMQCLPNCDQIIFLLISRKPLAEKVNFLKFYDIVFMLQFLLKFLQFLLADTQHFGADINTLWISEWLINLI